MKSKNNKNNRISQINKNDADRIKELEQQVLSLKVENEYLKELRRLHLKERQKNKS
ncbi:hypothetical protein [Miniphocaeibacter halophilus]|uniref:Uncharacterized protein n=1 Tax=Miniphocaeibacter halophilus TaxID=2931922 RepID=A0AC61MPV8_9FIRM|nr:hypothetical protein [Miniphocaeibacter halophilus]QQK07258.1 hypothetical protein JFY71_08000 [Miniphocaeibacter halophilus]